MTRCIADFARHPASVLLLGGGAPRTVALLAGLGGLLR